MLVPCLNPAGAHLPLVVRQKPGEKSAKFTAEGGCGAMMASMAICAEIKYPRATFLMTVIKPGGITRLGGS
jgi:hypothetical protein